MFQYLSIDQSNWELYKIQSSKFWAKCYTGSTINEVKIAIQTAKEIYPKATHWCYGAVLNFPNNTLASSDNGEPNGTAGLPIQRSILSKNLQNTFVIVVRFYGGTKLGTRGLIEAYGNSAAQALEKSTFKFFHLSKTAFLTTNFLNENEIYTILTKLNTQIVKRTVQGSNIVIEIDLQSNMLVTWNKLIAVYYKVIFIVK